MTASPEFFTQVALAPVRPIDSLAALACGADSLNVATAGTIVMWEALRQWEAAHGTLAE